MSHTDCKDVTFVLFTFSWTMAIGKRISPYIWIRNVHISHHTAAMKYKQIKLPSNM